MLCKRLDSVQVVIYRLEASAGELRLEDAMARTQLAHGAAARSIGRSRGGIDLRGSQISRMPRPSACFAKHIPPPSAVSSAALITTARGWSRPPA